MNRLNIRLRVAMTVTVCALVMPYAVNASLVQSYVGTGNLGVEVVAVGFGGAPTVMSFTNTLNLVNMPVTATPVRAYLYALDTNHPGTMTANFNGVPLLGGTATGPYAQDAAFNTLYTFRWDVTALIAAGVSNYSWSFGEVPDMFMNQGGSISMSVLAVVYSDPSLPTNTVALYDGMTYVGSPLPETETLSITGLPAGPTSIQLATYLDDNFSPPGSSGEVIRFNGTAVGGPLDGNLALNGSVTAFTGTAIAGVDSMSITTPLDEFGWVVSAFQTPVPVPASFWLFATALAFVGMFKRGPLLKR